MCYCCCQDIITLAKDGKSEELKVALRENPNLIDAKDEDGKETSLSAEISIPSSICLHHLFSQTRSFNLILSLSQDSH